MHTRAGSQGALCIGTHDGTFHCDEALAVGMLKLLPEYRDACKSSRRIAACLIYAAGVVRSRDPSILQRCAVVVDVGAEYAPER
jgi:uncharacterized UPF0160 family protein